MNKISKRKRCSLSMTLIKSKRKKERKIKTKRAFSGSSEDL
jgi:hypothetical protein